MKIKVEELGCFEQVAKVIGPDLAKVELCKVFKNQSKYKAAGQKLMTAFAWPITPQGSNFWASIYSGVDPYEN